MADDDLIGLVHSAKWRPEKGPDLLKVPRKRGTGLVFRTNGLMVFQKRRFGRYFSFYLAPGAPLDATFWSWAEGASKLVVNSNVSRWGRGIVKPRHRVKANELVQEFEGYKILEFDKEDIEEIVLVVKGRWGFSTLSVEVRSGKGNFRLDLASLGMTDDLTRILFDCLEGFASEKTSVVPYKGKKGYKETVEFVENWLDGESVAIAGGGVSIGANRPDSSPP